MLQLLILGLLCEGDRHPYEVMQTMKERSMETYIKINYGTLYYNFEKLLERGDIAVKEIVQEEKRPDKTIYRITEQGRERFRVLLAEQFAENAPNYHPLYPALLFTRFGDEAVIREALLSRREKMEHKADRVELRIGELEERIHWGSLQIMKNSLLHLRTEIGWIDGFLKELERKGLQGEPPCP